MRKVAIASVLAVALAVSGSAFAREVAGVNLQDSISVNGKTLVLNGAGIRKKMFIKVYAAGLYLEKKDANPATILAADAERRMAMHFVYSVGKEKIAEAWTEGLTANVPNASPEMKAAFKTLESWMEDVDSGKGINLTYVPGTGTTVEVNGKVKGVLPGKPTADAILSTWIGPKPGPGDDFKAGILGK